MAGCCLATALCDDPGMPTHSLVRVLVLAVLATTHGCGVALDLPDGAVVQCASNADCPGGLICHPAAGRCVDSGEFDLEPPTLSGLTIGAERTSTLIPVSATFRVGEEPATLTFTMTPESAPSVQGTCAVIDAATQAWTCTRTLGGDEAPADEETPATINVTVADAAGNAASASGRVVIDFKKPTVEAASLTYVPGPDNRLREVTAATDGTRVIAIFNTSEILDTVEPPTLAARIDATTVVPFTLSHQGVAAATFELEVDESFEDGVYPLELGWTDRAGNLATNATLPAGSDTLSIKRSHPCLAVRQDQVTYVRSPFGNAAIEAIGAATIPAGPYFALVPGDPLGDVAAMPPDTFQVGVTCDGTDALSPATELVFWSSFDFVLGGLRPNATGWPRTAVAPNDSIFLRVSGLDVAGNESAPVQIQNAELITTSRFPWGVTSPNRLEQVPVVDPLILTQPTGTGASGLETDGRDDTRLGVLGRAWWQEISAPAVAETPEARYGHGLAYDAARGRTVLFGGYRAAILQDTWEWDGRRWTRMTPATQSPSPVCFFGMAYDGRRGRVVVHGGNSVLSPYVSYAVSEWDGVDWRVEPYGASQQLRHHAMAYDARAGELVALGGDYIYYGEQLNPVAYVRGVQGFGMRLASPPARTFHSMAFDDHRGVLVLFGGNASLSPAAALRNDVWELVDGTWINRSPGSGDAPSPRDFAALAYDSVRQRTVLFGGNDGVGALNDVWEWDGTSWLEVTPPLSESAPSIRCGHAMVFDTRRGRMVVFGGLTGATGSYCNSGTASSETWEWDGRHWHQRSGEWPGLRIGAAMAWDPTHHAALLFGGYEGAAWAPGTWLWDGEDWHDVTVGTTQEPALRAEPALVFDPDSNKIVLFGGRDSAGAKNDMWEWDGDVRDWSPVTPTSGGAPDPRSQHSLAYDEEHHRLVVFGGVDSAVMNDLWTWDRAAGTWDGPVVAASPAARLLAGMAFIPTRGVVLYGGNSGTYPAALADTWFWDGAIWTTLTSGLSPTARWGHGLTRDPSRGSLLLFGGIDDINHDPTGDTWELGADGWLPVASVSQVRGGSSMPGRIGFAMAYDVDRRAALVYGGQTKTDNTARTLQDFWQWNGRAERSPGVVFTAGIADAGVSASQIVGLRVRAWAAAEAASPAPETAVLGAALYAWSGFGPGRSAGSWVPLDGPEATNDLGTGETYDSAAAALHFESTTAEEARQYAQQGDGTISILVRPKGIAGRASLPTDVSFDYIEVRVRYVGQ
jgi:hypothetical protein